MKDAFLGNTIAPKESQGSGDFASASGMLYSDKNTLYFTNRYDGSKAVHKISTQETIKKIHVSGNQLYLELDQRIDVFIIP